MVKKLYNQVEISYETMTFLRMRRIRQLCILRLFKKSKIRISSRCRYVHSCIDFFLIHSPSFSPSLHDAGLDFESSPDNCLGFGFISSGTTLASLRYLLFSRFRSISLSLYGSTSIKIQGDLIREGLAPPLRRSWMETAQVQYRLKNL